MASAYLLRQCRYRPFPTIHGNTQQYFYINENTGYVEICGDRIESARYKKVTSLLGKCGERLLVNHFVAFPFFMSLLFRSCDL